MKERKPTQKRIAIDKFKEQFVEMTYPELNTEAQKIAFSLMDQYPNSWNQELKTNRKHEAIMELMYEKRL